MMTSGKPSVPTKRGRATEGRIVQLSHGRLCGIIRATDGQSVFFHGRDLDGSRYNDLHVGGSVSFELIEDAISGPRAAMVRLTTAVQSATS